MDTLKIWIGFDPRETAAYAVARKTVRRHAPSHWEINGLILADLQEQGLYTRPIEWRDGVDRKIMWDVISDAPMSTEHANARFLVPYLAKSGFAIFMDGDMMVRNDMRRLVERFDGGHAVYCVKHRHEPPPGVKMDGQQQTRYQRKNWSSFMAFDCDHPANKALTPEMVNVLPGRDLHRFCWLNDDEIGEIDQSWNFLVGHTDPEVVPDNVHFTEGCPDMRGYENVPYADEWRLRLNDWARGALSFPG